MISRVHFSGRRPLDSEPRRALKELIAEVLDEHGATGTVSVVFVGDDEIRGLHRDYLGEDRATDVITFPLEDEDNDQNGAPQVDDLVGEVVVSVDTARREADRRGLPLERELALYSLHGVLHLLGFDDKEPGARGRMRRAEKRYLERFEY